MVLALFPLLLEIPCSIHLSYGRVGGFRGPRGRLADGWPVAGVKNLFIFYHGRGGEGTTGGLERLPADIGRSLGVGTDVVAERRLDRFVPHQLLEYRRSARRVCLQRTRLRHRNPRGDRGLLPGGAGRRGEARSQRVAVRLPECLAAARSWKELLAHNRAVLSDSRSTVSTAVAFPVNSIVSVTVATFGLFTRTRASASRPLAEPSCHTGWQRWGEERRRRRTTARQGLERERNLSGAAGLQEIDPELAASRIPVLPHPRSGLSLSQQPVLGLGHG